MPRIPYSLHRAKYLLALILITAGLTSLLALLSYSSSRQQRLTGSAHVSEATGAPANPDFNSAGPATGDPAQARAAEAYGKLPLSFEANEGQAHESVKFLSRGSGYSLFLTSTEAVLTLRSAGFGLRNEKDSLNPQSSVVRMKLLGANASPQVEGQDELPGKSNHFKGQDQAKWRTGVRNYARVKYEQVYPGIDLVYYGNQRSLEYDFVIAPFAAPKTIMLAFEGARCITVDESGDLVLDTAGGKVRQRKPVIYQEVNGVRQEIAGGYALKGKHEASFRVGDYDPSRPLVIDPVLDYSTYLGGGGSGDVGYDVAVDAAGNAYVTGVAGSSDFPTTVGAFQTTFLGGPYDVFVTKFNAAGSALVYSTYLGGTLRDEAFSIGVDAVGNAYITGQTLSTDFPTTIGAFQTTFHSGTTQSVDAFVTKLNPAGSALVYSTYLGGTDNDLANSIAIDAAGSAYVTGKTSSTDFPTMVPFQATLKGVGDAFITKLNPAGTALDYSTYLGGAHDSFDNGSAAPDIGNGIAVDADGNAYVTGMAGSDDFPTTAGAFQTTIAGSQDFAGDAFVTKLSDTGTALVYSTYLGGLRGDQGNAIALNSAGNAYVTGMTQSSNFPTLNPIRATNDSDYDADAFVTKLNPSGTALVYSTYIGAQNSDTGNDIVVDSTNRATIIGTTNSIFFPVVNPPVQEKAGLSYDAFVTSLNATGSSIFYSSLIGGSGNESGNGIGIDPSGNIYLTGSTTSVTTNPFTNPFPTSNPFQATRRGQGDAFVSKIAVNATGFSISGHLTSGVGAGVTVNLGGSRRESTTTDSNGNYIFRNLAAGRSYTVTPISASFGSFIPQSTTFNNLSQDETADFIEAFKIIGRVLDRDFNPIAGVTVTLSGSQTATTQTDSNGDYEFLNLPAQGGYTVKPSQAGLYFSPPQWTVDPLINNQSLEFTAGSLPAPWTYEDDIGSVGVAGSASYDNGVFTINGSGADIGGTNDAFHYVHQRLTTTDGEIVARVASIQNTNADAKAGIMFRDDDVEGNARYVAMLVTPGGEVRFQRRTTKGGLSTTTTSTGSVPVWLKLVRRASDTYRGYVSGDGVNWELVGTETIPMSQYLYVGMVVSSHDNSALCTATFDNVAAKITITAPEEGASFPTNTSIPVSAVVNGFANKVDFYANDTLIGTDTTGPYAITWDGVKPSGNYTLTARATDAQGTTSSSAVMVKIEGTAPEYSISGRVMNVNGGLKGVTVALSGSLSKQTTTSADGSYSFTGLTQGGNYTITPSRLNMTFTPPSRSFTALSGNKINVNFNQAPLTIKGLIKVGTAGLGGVSVTLSSPGLPSRTVTTNSAGSYTFASLQPGRNYTVTPLRTNYTFTPASRTYTNMSLNTTANFIATLKTYSINGRVLRSGTTTGIAAVTMTITSATPAGFAARTVNTGSTGYYRFTGLPAGRAYTIKASKTGFTFSPAARNIGNLSADIPAGTATSFTGTQ